MIDVLRRATIPDMKQRIRAMLAAKKRLAWTNEQIAQRARCSSARVGQILRGDTPQYKMVLVEAVERALGVGGK